MLLEDETTTSTAKERFVLADYLPVHTAVLSKKIRKYLTRQSSKLYDQQTMEQKIDIRRANRFHLDDDFVRMSLDVAQQSTDIQIAQRMESAALPYDKVWIEFDYAAFLQWRGENGFCMAWLPPPREDDTWAGSRFGFLLKRVPNSHAWTMSGFWGNEGELGYLPNAFRFDPSGRETREDFSFHKLLKLISEEEGEQAYSTLLGTAWEFIKAESVPTITEIKVDSVLSKHSFVSHSYCYYVREHMQQFLVDDMTEEEWFNLGQQILMYHALGTSGLLRWIITILTLLNEVPVATRLVEPSKGPGRIRNTQLNYHVLKLRLPKTKPVNYLIKRLDKAMALRRRRAHDVRLHWRTYERNTSPVCLAFRKEHDWEYDHDNGYRLCRRHGCDTFGVRIAEHVRGDETLGWVRKDYDLSPSNDR